MFGRAEKTVQEGRVPPPGFVPILTVYNTECKPLYGDIKWWIDFKQPTAVTSDRTQKMQLKTECDREQCTYDLQLPRHVRDSWIHISQQLQPLHFLEVERWIRHNGPWVDTHGRLLLCCLLKGWKKPEQNNCVSTQGTKVTSLTIGEHVFVWLRNARCANISLSGWIRFHYIVTTIVCHVKTAAGFKVKGLYF